MQLIRRTNPVVLGIALMGLGILPFGISLLVNVAISASDPQAQSSIGLFLRRTLVTTTPICSALLFTSGIVVLGLAAMGRFNREQPNE
jgi:hypothetical protein